MVHNIDITDLNKIAKRGRHIYREGGVEKVSTFRYVLIKMHGYVGDSSEGFKDMITLLGDLGYECLNPSFGDYLYMNEYFFSLDLVSFKYQIFTDVYEEKKRMIEHLEKGGYDVFLMSHYTFTLYNSDEDTAMLCYGSIKLKTRYTNPSLASYREF